MKPISNKYTKLALSSTLTLASSVAFSAPALEEVIVTAQKRSESIQDVPVSINAVSAETMAKNGISNLEEMSTLVPNLNISDSPDANIIMMRGLGSGAGNVSFEQSVGLYVDGIYAGRSPQFQIPFLDVQRVEVLRGPQGVIFGKNSIAGAISIHSARPSEEFEGIIQSSYEANYGSTTLTGILSGPALESAGLGARLVVSDTKDKSFVENHYNGEGPGEPDYASSAQAIRLLVDWAATENTLLWAKFEHSTVDEEGVKFQLIHRDPNTTQTDPILLPFTNNIIAAQEAAGEDYKFDTKNFADGQGNDSFLNQEASSFTLNAAHMMGEFEITYIGGYSEYDRMIAVDGDFSGSNLLVTNNNEDFEQVSHELRFTSPLGGRIDYMGGLYYLKRDLVLPNTNVDIDLQTQLPGGAGIAFTMVRDYFEFSEGYSGFFQATWNITDTFSATLGARRSFEEKSASAVQTLNDYRSEEPLTNPITLLVANASGTNNYNYGEQIRKEANTDGTFNLQWVVNDDVNLYFTHARATKGGGFNASDSSGNIDGFEYDEERARNYELGAKMELFDRRLRLNTAVFYTDFDDLQVSTFTGDDFIVGNAGSSVSKGAELELTFLATEEILLGVNAAVLRARYREFRGQCPTVQSEQSAECQASEDGLQDYRGRPLLAAPDTSASAFIDYTKAFDSLIFNVRLDAKFSDEYYFAPAQESTTLQEAYWKYNANIGLANIDNTWSVSLAALNLTDERTINFGGPQFLVPGSFFGNLEDPRMYAMNFRYAF
ncbi:TonB-dependent receptor [Spongiibacter sp. KMU-166]|uniref:TonB-dependent receptor n=1 Tax=Spongiibacter thalassae TaxID=2721624 RepID=A0ABX1G9X5_9GAMM|nr:TonB-dependent receptor [Spongiibacter thalassae]NKI15958.1 TonB-dependent receptor [Spongiibacter thalassae]